MFNRCLSEVHLVQHSAQCKQLVPMANLIYCQHCWQCLSSIADRQSQCPPCPPPQMPGLVLFVFLHSKHMLFLWTLFPPLGKLTVLQEASSSGLWLLNCLWFLKDFISNGCLEYFIISVSYVFTENHLECPIDWKCKVDIWETGLYNRITRVASKPRNRQWCLKWNNSHGQCTLGRLCIAFPVSS